MNYKRLLQLVLLISATSDFWAFGSDPKGYYAALGTSINDDDATIKKNTIKYKESHV